MSQGRWTLARFQRALRPVAVVLMIFLVASIFVVPHAGAVSAVGGDVGLGFSRFSYDTDTGRVSTTTNESALVMTDVAAIPGRHRSFVVVSASPIRQVYDSSHSFVAPSTGGIAGTAARNADELLTNGRQVRGNFPNSASPNEVLYRAGPDGSVTYYQVYDDLGRPVMRVDLVGRAHGGIPTPHVQEYVLNTNPATGQTFVNKGPVRAALPKEIPS